MEVLKEKPITLADLRWGLKGNTDLIDKLECIKYYKTAKKIDTLKKKIENMDLNQQIKQKLLSINDLSELKEEIGKWNMTNCMNILLKLKREGLIKIYKDILGYTRADLEDLRGKAPKTSSYTPVQVVLGRKNKTYTIQQQKDFLKNKGLDDIIDFDEFSTNIVKKDREELQLTTPQKNLIKKFAVGNEVGLIAIWGLGTGKTTLASLSAMIYLQIYPDSRVIFISPASLLVNFVKTLDSYNVDIRDNRIEYYSYESYLRKKANCENALVIIDEAHNLRTPSSYEILENAHTEAEEKIKYKSGKRGGEIRRFCLNKARKILLLTGTPMVNTPYDIQTLMSMVNQLPIVSLLQPDEFYKLLNDEKQVKDYFSCKLSIFFNPKVDNREDDPFPEKVDDFLLVYFPENYERAYDKLLNSQNLQATLREIEEDIGKQKVDRLRKLLEPKNKKKGEDDFEDDIDGNPKAFFNGVRRLVNIIDDLKVKAVVGNIKKWNDENNKNSRNVIYTGFIDTGVKVLQKEISNNNLSYSLVSGGMGLKQKSEAVEKYNNGEIDILIITKSGAEGLDLKKTTNLYLLDGVWNEALASQIIGRGIRFKSHQDLPLEERKVNVYRVFMIKKDEEPFALKMKEALQNPSDFETLFMLIKEAEDNQKLGELASPPKRNPKTFIFLNVKKRQEIKEGKERLKQQLKDKQITKAQYNQEITKYDAREIWKDSSFNRFGSKEALLENYFGKDDVKYILTPTIDLRMFILSKSKQGLIDNVFTVLQDDDFVKTIETKYCMTQNEMEYEKELTLFLNSPEFKSGKFNERQLKDIRIKIYSRIINKNLKTLNDDFLKYSKLKVKTPNVKLQQYFSNENLIKLMIDLSSLKDFDKEVVRILEPTAGDGAILKYLINNFSNKFRLFLRTTEIDEANREQLKEVLKNDLDILYEEPDFMKLEISDAFDYVFMNPPFNLDGGLKDLDFILKAYTHLKYGGELVSIVFAPHLKTKIQNTEFKNKIESIYPTSKFFISTTKKQKFREGGSGKIKDVNIKIVNIIKKEEDTENIINIIDEPIDEPDEPIDSLIEGLPELKNIDILKDSNKLLDDYQGWLGIPSFELFLWDYILDKHKNDCSPIYNESSVLQINLRKITEPNIGFFDEKRLQKPLPINEGVEVIKKELNRCKKRFIPLPIQLVGHLNMAIIDIKNKTLERFEPHGDFYRGRSKIKDLNEKIDKILIDISEKLNLKYLPAKEVCPFESGFQSLEGKAPSKNIELQFKNAGKEINLKQGGLCALWSFLYLDLRLTFTNLSPKEIMEQSIYKSIPKKEKSVNYLSVGSYNILKLRQLALSYIVKTIDMDKDILEFFNNPKEAVSDTVKEYLEDNKTFFNSLGKYLEKEKISPRGFFIFTYDVKKQQIKLKGLKNPNKVDTYLLGVYLDRYLIVKYIKKLIDNKKANEPKIEIVVKKKRVPLVIKETGGDDDDIIEKKEKEDLIRKLDSEIKKTKEKLNDDSQLKKLRRERRITYKKELEEKLDDLLKTLKYINRIYRMDIDEKIDKKLIKGL